MFSRRHFTVASAGLLLAACAGAPPAPDQIKQYVALIAAGLADLAGALERIPGGVPAAVVAQVNGELAIIEANAAQVATGPPQPSLLQAIAAAISAIYPLVTPFFPAAPAIAVALQAALALISIVLRLAGVTPAVHLQASPMPEKEAAAVLHGYAETGIR